jgi:hypothetical protein
MTSAECPGARDQRRTGWHGQAAAMAISSYRFVWLVRPGQLPSRGCCRPHDTQRQAASRRCGSLAVLHATGPAPAGIPRDREDDVLRFVSDLGYSRPGPDQTGRARRQSSRRSPDASAPSRPPGTTPIRAAASSNQDPRKAPRHTAAHRLSARPRKTLARRDRPGPSAVAGFIV